VKGVLEGMGYPAFASEQFLKRLVDAYLTTVPQLEEMDKKDWKELGYTDEIITQVRKELSALGDKNKKPPTFNDSAKENEASDDSFGNDLFITSEHKPSETKKKNQKTSVSIQDNEKMTQKDKDQEKAKTKEKNPNEDETRLENEAAGEKQIHEDSSVEFEDF